MLERQLKHDNESSKSLSNEKQEYLKQINCLEQQVLKVEEENIIHKKENLELKKKLKELNAKVLEMDNFSIRRCEDEVKNLLELINKEQMSRNSLEQMLELIEYNVKKYKFMHEKNFSKPDANTINASTLRLSNNSSWQERRSARVDKQDLLTLQLELKSEIADKQKIQSELTKLQQEYDNLAAQLNDSKMELSRVRKQMKTGTSDSSHSYPLTKSDHNTSESDLGDNTFLKDYAILSINNKKHNMVGISQELYENFDYHNKFGHSFIIRTFITPIKCYICTSIMIGLVRQGYVCEGIT